MYVFGIVMMLGQDGQKYFTLKHKKGLITYGWNARCRNTNYLGEIMLYASFNVIAQATIVWQIYVGIWSTIFMQRMICKEYALSKKEGWEEYKQKTWFLLPKMFGSSMLSCLFYAILTVNSYIIYELGGIEVSIKLLKLHFL